MKIQGKTNTSNPTTLGEIFLVLGLASAIAMSFVIYNGIGSDDFFYVTQTVDGVTLREYHPEVVILLLTVWGLATAIFLATGFRFLVPKREKYTYSLHSTLFDPEKEPTNITVTKQVPKKLSKRVFPDNPADFFLKLFSIIGVSIIAIGVALLIWDRTSILSLSETEATVIRTYHESHQKSNSIHSYTVYYADILYEAEGQQYQSRLTVSMFFNKSTVTIYYSPENPLDCRMDNEFIVWYIVLFSIGLFFLGTGILVKWIDKKNTHN